MKTVTVESDDEFEIRRRPHDHPSAPVYGRPRIGVICPFCGRANVYWLGSLIEERGVVCHGCPAIHTAKHGQRLSKRARVPRRQPLSSAAPARPARRGLPPEEAPAVSGRAPAGAGPVKAGR